MSKCHSPVLLSPSFFRIMAFVIVSTFSLVAISMEFGWHEASATLMKPASPWSWSHRHSATVIRIGMVAVESRRASEGFECECECEWEGEGER